MARFVLVFARFLLSAVFLIFGKFFVEGLILAQDERWRRA